MANVNIKFNGKEFLLSCEDRQEDHLEELAIYLKDKLPKVLMLTGKKGIGKFTLVHHLLAYNHDRKNYDQSNYTIMEKNLFLTTPKKNLYNNINYYSGEDKSVKIENIRNLRLNLQKTTIDNKVRFIILDDVEKFNLNCLNALLKTIEEPSIFNHFIDYK